MPEWLSDRAARMSVRPDRRASCRGRRSERLIAALEAGFDRKAQTFTDLRVNVADPVQSAPDRPAHRQPRAFIAGDEGAYFAAQAGRRGDLTDEPGAFEPQ